jgi:hypothetical protein
MEVLFCILEESMALGDRVLVFSQSLFTLNLIEDFLQRTNLPGRQEKWARNWNYYRKLSTIRILCVSLLNFKPFFIFLKFEGGFFFFFLSFFPWRMIMCVLCVCLCLTQSKAEVVLLHVVKLCGE